MRKPSTSNRLPCFRRIGVTRAPSTSNGSKPMRRNTSCGTAPVCRSLGRLERVVERLANPLLDARLAIQRHRPAQIKLHQPQIVQPEHVVRVLVRVEHGVHDADLLAQQLLPQVGRRVDQAGCRRAGPGSRCTACGDCAGCRCGTRRSRSRSAGTPTLVPVPSRIIWPRMSVVRSLVAWHAVDSPNEAGDGCRRVRHGASHMPDFDVVPSERASRHGANSA